MSDIKVASRYAKSIFELASEKGTLEQTSQDFKLIEEVCEQNREFTLMLKNPIIDISKKWEIVKAIFEGKVSDLTLRFLQVVNDKKRIDHIRSIADSFEARYNEKNGIIKAHLETTFQLDAEQFSQFEQIALARTGAKAVQLEAAVNPALIGGYIFRIGDQMIDNSVKNRLTKLRQSLTAKV
ncbi:ATP synthase F1 subunit delta [Persicobacter psychrovividus]|uniref:ATP synthase subunit delta n=1 Tax=Persicobacter psychrovividus TaxID=387638 RepID=A0ABM7VGX0_9BACT|nr:ATP synthase subunit delta [Persicobacter psychrovividus]